MARFTPPGPRAPTRRASWSPLRDPRGRPRRPAPPGLRPPGAHRRPAGPPARPDRQWPGRAAPDHPRWAPRGSAEPSGRSSPGCGGSAARCTSCATSWPSPRGWPRRSSSRSASRGSSPRTTPRRSAAAWPSSPASGPATPRPWSAWKNDREERLTCRQFPLEPRKRSRTTNRLERTFGESRRRTTGIPRFQHEQACLALVFATLITAADRWRGGVMRPPRLRALEVLRADGQAARHAA